MVTITPVSGEILNEKEKEKKKVNKIILQPIKIK